MAGGTALTQYDAAQKKRLRTSALLIFLVLPALLAVSVFLLDSRWYLPLSVLMLGCIMAPFFMVFERRRPKAREIVLIAMMSAIVTCAQVFFHIVLPIQIGTALVIISGIALGPEAGFLVGALARFVCNFYLGQGLWTPWQMFCWGLLGFLAGLCFNRAETGKVNSRSFQAVMGPVMTVLASEILAYLSWLAWPGTDEGFLSWRLYAFGAVGLLVGALLGRRRLPCDHLTLGLFTFLSIFIVYGGIMNFAALVTSASAMADGFSLDALRLLYISGVPYDLLHAATATACVLIFGEPLIRKLERIKIKYGIYR
ncbi:MAG: ECF transporter S component [Firmicutes bacterium]|nr:ECF transporter S component [Bacillota bacterium]